MDRVFDALASSTRRRILAYLSEVDLTAGEIAERFSLAQPSISKHLSILEAAGLVWRQREGQYMRYGLKRDTVAATLGGLLRELCPPSRALRKESRSIAKTRKVKTAE